MFRSNPFGRLLALYLALLCLGIGVVGVAAGVRLRTAYLESRRSALRDNARLVSELVREDLTANRHEALERRIAGLGQEIGCRITVIGRDGTVLADNWQPAAEMNNHLARPEIAAAVLKGEAFSERESDTIHQRMLFLAKRVEGSGGRVYYLRLAVPLRAIGQELWLLYAAMGSIAIAGMLAAGAIAYHFVHQRTRPIVELSGLAEALSRGELQQRITHSGEGEVGRLGSALNTMAASMRELLTQTEKDRAELLTILATMSDGVIATDAQQYIRVINQAAGNLLGFDTVQAHGKPLWQIVRIERLIKMAQEVLSSGKKGVVQIAMTGGRHLEIWLCPFPAEMPAEGLVVVIHDTTQAVRYQELRKEFVANVSHELRTPLTVIKGFVETLQDGTMADPVKGPQYLATIERHTNQQFKGVRNLNVAVREWQDQVIFLHRIVEGGTDRSYGIHVARLAGVPKPVLKRAKDLLGQLAVHVGGPARKRKAADPNQLDLFTAEPPTHELVTRLTELELDDLSPRQAFDLLREWKEKYKPT